MATLAHKGRAVTNSANRATDPSASLTVVSASPRPLSERDFHQRINAAAARSATEPTTTVAMICARGSGHGLSPPLEDSLIDETGQILIRMCRSTDVVGRLDDHRLGILADVLLYPKMALMLCDRLLATICRSVGATDSSTAVVTSFGITAVRQGDDASLVLARASSAVATAMSTGGGFAFAPGDLRRDTSSA